MRRQYENIYYYKRNVEVDFYIPDASLLIQVSYDIANPDTEKREVKALFKAKEELQCKNTLIITYDTEKIITYKNTNFNIIPVWQWLIENS